MAKRSNSNYGLIIFYKNMNRRGRRGYQAVGIFHRNPRLLSSGRGAGGKLDVKVIELMGGRIYHIANFKSRQHRRRLAKRGKRRQ